MQRTRRGGRRFSQERRHRRDAYDTKNNYDYDPACAVRWMAGWLVFIDIASSGANPSPFVSDGRTDGQTGGRRPGGTGCPHFTFVRFGGATERFPGVRRSLIVVYTTRSAVCRLISDAFQSPPPPSECRRRRRSQTNGAASNQLLCDAILPSSAAPCPPNNCTVAAYSTAHCTAASSTIYCSRRRHKP